MEPSVPVRGSVRGRADPVFECLARQLGDGLTLSGGDLAGAVSDGGCNAEGDLRGHRWAAGQGGAAGGATDLLDDLISDLVSESGAVLQSALVLPEIDIGADGVSSVIWGRLESGI